MLRCDRFRYEETHFPSTEAGTRGTAIRYRKIELVATGSQAGSLSVSRCLRGRWLSSLNNDDAPTIYDHVKDSIAYHVNQV